ncbi:uncharacterized protein EI90DRAFT_83086 [Cantharellus anzutake]|uniref:uncharacterized protein n=1 Tax=Cantharellus anzutake TaxID=1750568 RepID=UPI001902FCEA|nr:uncharacterized protein EI90DRAFT_83086 [Cantharellus anzutake]KAF8336892.1 hypothetical protein EI90DRAFT_83086 [Cantharellus anzutake]
MTMTPFEHLSGGYTYGILFIAIFLGITTVQSRSYFLSYPNDPVVTKLLVLALMLVQFFGLGCCLSGQYRMVISRKDSPIKNSWYNSEFTMSTVVCSILVQSFFSWRIRKMTNVWVALPVMMTSLLQLGVYIVGNLHPQVYSLPNWNRTPVVGLCAAQATADTLIAAIMIVLLRRSRTGFGRTDRAIGILVRYAIHTGAVTSVLALIILIAFVVYDGFHFMHIWFSVSLGGVYTITLLANLHARSHVRQYLVQGPIENAGQSIHLSKLPARIKGRILHAIPLNMPSSIKSSEPSPSV